MKAVIFDLDGVIADTARFHFVAWQQLATELGITIDGQFNEQLKGISRTESLARILAHGGKTGLYSQVQLDQFAERKNDNYLQLISRLDANDILPGIVAFLDEIAAAGLSVALASASRNGPFILSKLGLSERFDTIVDPAQLAAGKPAPDIYLTAAAQLNVAPSDCVGVEDALAGVEAINAAKMVSIAVGDETELAPANHIFASTAGLKLATVKSVWEAAQL
ncbi:beta-phosphoglucomutase [Brochothrix campestris]|uniref:Beta-phosphoglucomutase n=1 Tax=Brochothrix campestris FSL F6-1037 TaxID=1265861 RepID=W7CQ43_9LIST|nr:beta-phosphoglucomutase [Brochothrix campestris]EUJ39202.1 beta-phosphoglucomutase [Brochothrix campestris FSL F6-1037]